MFACKEGCLIVVSYLLSEGAKVNAKDNVSGHGVDEVFSSFQ